METLKIRTRYRVQTPEPDKCHIALVGCGGTGSFLALHLARLLYHARDRYGYRIPMTFVDPDVVERKNLGRQNFAPAEVGRNKAETLAWRYNMAFGLAIEARAATFEDARITIDYARWGLIIGAVDNAAARASIAQAFDRRRYNPPWWLDCGNHEHAGQVLLGNDAELKAPEISPLGFCSGLPLPTVQHPELLEEAPASTVGESCADLALADIQSLMINQAIATYAAQYVYRLLISRDLNTYATYVDLETGTAKSVGITRN
jgi:PRTRC genetic system ThiF family protein